MTDPIVVTDHALRRYLERVRGLDAGVLFDHETDRAIIRAILKSNGLSEGQAVSEICAIVAEGIRLGAAAVRLDGYRYVLKGQNVLTVLPKGARTTRSPRYHIAREAASRYAEA